jgi:hypothetical protein
MEGFLSGIQKEVRPKDEGAQNLCNSEYSVNAYSLNRSNALVPSDL